jgi:TrmH family RNA methyltransferase
MARLSALKSPSAVLAEGVIDRRLLLERLAPPGPWLALDGLQDPGNVGAIYRSAAAFGLPFLILIPPAPDPFSEKVIRASAGASLRVPTWRPASVDALRAEADRAGLGIAVLDPRGETDLTALPAAERFLFVVGNEGHGVSEAIVSGASLRVRIPTSSCTESLNASTAASLLLFTLDRGYRSGLS